MPEHAWQRACRRAEIIGPLEQSETVGHEAADAAAQALGLSRRQVYVLIRRARQDVNSECAMPIIIETMKASPYSPHYDSLRVWLKECRLKKDLSLREVADIVGRHHSVIGKIEQDRRKIELMEFVQYCNTLNVDPHEGLEILIQSLKKTPQQPK